MTSDLTSPAIELLSNSGANAASTSNGADLHIQLASNSDFTDALKQVMHVASLTSTTNAATPMRVAIEIQTPPGAIVNVYVSKQGDGYRAQLSTNDPQALAWVQDQMSSLKSTDVGVNVRWLPPQIESGVATTTGSSSGQDANLGWDRGGQGQSQYQQPDERSQSERQKRAGIVPEFVAAGSNSFMNSLASLGRAA